MLHYGLLHSSFSEWTIIKKYLQEPSRQENNARV